MLKQIEKMQIVTVLQDIQANELNGDDLLKRVENFEIEMASSKAQLGVFGLTQAESRYKQRYGADNGLRYLQSLKV